MPYSCAFPTCSNGVKSGKRFYRFPKDNERCRKWVMAINNPKLFDKNIMHLHISNRVCEDHFSPWCFMNASYKKRLVHNAIPACHSKPLSISDINTEQKVSINKKNSENEQSAVAHSEKEPSGIPACDAKLSVKIQEDQSEMDRMDDDASCFLVDTSLQTIKSVTSGNNDRNLSTPTEPNLTLISATNHHNISKSKLILNLPLNNNINYNATNSILVLNATDHNNSSHFNFMKPKLILNSVADNRYHCNTAKPNLFSNSVADNNQNNNNSTGVNMVLNFTADDNNKNHTNPTEANLAANPAEDNKMHNTTKAKLDLNSETDKSNCSPTKPILALNTVEDNNRNKYNFMKPKLILNSGKDKKNSIYDCIKPESTLNSTTNNSKNHNPMTAKSIFNSVVDNTRNHIYLARPKLILKPAADKNKYNHSRKMKLTRKLKRMLTSIQYAHLFQPIPHWCKRRILYRKVHY